MALKSELNGTRGSISFAAFSGTWTRVEAGEARRSNGRRLGDMAGPRQASGQGGVRRVEFVASRKLTRGRRGTSWQTCQARGPSSVGEWGRGAS